MRFIRRIIKIREPISLLILILLLYSNAQVFGDEHKVKIIYDNATLKTKFGELECPEGTIFTVLKNGKTKLKVKGKIFNSEISGVISVYAVENISDNKNADDYDVISQDVRESDEDYDESDEDQDNSLKYLGFYRTPNFFDALYDTIKDHYVLSNRLTQKIVLKHKLIEVDSATELKKLKQGDIVLLKGRLFSRPNFSIVKISNDLFNKNKRVLLLGKNYTDEEPIQIDFSGYAEFRPDLDAKKYPVKVLGVFQNVTEDQILLTKEDFIEAIKSGYGFQKMCKECNGTGIKPETKRKCIHCHGEGYLSPIRTSLEINQDQDIY